MHACRSTLEDPTEGEWAIAPFTARREHQGYPGFVHGGVVGSILDEAMGWATYGHGIWAITGKIENRFRGIIPINEPLEVRGRITRDRGRTLNVIAELRDSGGTVVAEGEGLFFRVDGEQARRIEEAVASLRAAGLGHDDPPSNMNDPANGARLSKKRTANSKKAAASAPPPVSPLTPAEILERLAPAYGVTEWRPHGDATAELVLTLLSQNTADTNSGRAFARLLERFPTWQAIIDAPLPEVEDAIRPGGLAPTKAPRLQALLREVQSRAGGFDLSFLKETPLDEARQWLRSLPAVGPKTAACVLVFALGIPALPVDTHVHRVSGRLGLAPAKMLPEKMQEMLEATVPPEDQFLFHVMLIRHGRHTCFAQRPACNRCALLDRCPAGQEFIGVAPKGAAPKSRKTVRQP